jgi:sugar phosphate permease
MISDFAAERMARLNIHYGWVIAGVTFMTMLVTAGALGAPGVLIVPLEKEFGWTTSEISSALALRLMLFGALAPFAAAFLNRFGVRRMILIALSIIIVGLTTSLFMTQLWQLVALWGVLIGVGSGLTAMVLGATVSARWFSQRRGLVVGILAASNATGQLVFQPLLAQFAGTIGWRGAIVFICIVLAVAGVFVFLLMRDRPADVGLPPYGDTVVAKAPATQHGFWTLVASPLTILKDAARVPVFWVLFATFFICGASTNGLIQTHFVSLCGDFGILPVGAASILAMMGAFDLVGTAGSGWLSDRYDNRWLLFWYYGLRGLSLIYLPFADFTLYGLSLFAMFYGLDWLATVPPTIKITQDRFGPERANIVFGWIFTGHQLGAAAIAFGAGFSRTELDSYLPAFFFSGALCVVAALLVLSITKARPKALKVQPA